MPAARCREMKASANGPFRWLSMFIITIVFATAGSLPVFAMSLFVHEAVSYPLTLIVMGLLAALASSWASNLLAGGSGHSRILRIVGITEAVAVLLCVTRILAYPLILVMVSWGLVLSTTAYLAARSFRRVEYSKNSDIVLTLVLVAAALALVVATVVFASRLR